MVLQDLVQKKIRDYQVVTICLIEKLGLTRFVTANEPFQSFCRGSSNLLPMIILGIIVWAKDYFLTTFFLLSFYFRSTKLTTLLQKCILIESLL